MAGHRESQTNYNRTPKYIPYLDLWVFITVNTSCINDSMFPSIAVIVRNETQQSWKKFVTFNQRHSMMLSEMGLNARKPVLGGLRTT